MSTKSGKIGHHKFHGDPARFEAVAFYIAQNYQGKVKRIADVAGGQGMLCRTLSKKYNFECEVVDPRGFTLVGVESRKEEYQAGMADYYDLIVGLHPDEALEEVVYSAKVRPVLVIPCCNFWNKEETLGREALLSKIEEFYQENGIFYKRVTFDFAAPKNIGLVSEPQIFLCSHCGKRVASEQTMDAHHRNHCPYCLWSLHLDLKKSGDRRAECGSLTEPLGLTFKQEGWHEDGTLKQGEIMLIHRCTKDQAISINRIAGDDDPQSILEIFEKGFHLEGEIKQKLHWQGIKLLIEADRKEVSRQLFGTKNIEPDTFQVQASCSRNLYSINVWHKIRNLV